MLWRPVELSQTSCNRAEWYASPHKRLQLTGPSYINLSSLTKSLPSIMPMRVHLVEPERLFLLSMMDFGLVFSSGNRASKWRWVFTHEYWQRSMNRSMNPSLCSKYQNVQPSELQWRQTRWEVSGSSESLVLIALWGRTISVTGWSISKQTLMLLGGRLYWSLTFLPTRP